MGKYFGTDGIRGVANKDLTPELAYKAGRCAAYELIDMENKVIVIGKDTRLSGDMLEAALIAGINSMGFDVYRLGVIPTPAVAYLTRYYKAASGIVISASHNPGEFNGIKFFANTGFKLPDEVEDDIEVLIDSNKIDDYRPIGGEIGVVKEIDNAFEIYREFLKTRVDMDLNGYKIALDCGNGATYKIAEDLFKSFGADVVIVNTQPDGLNINKNCGSTNSEIIKKLVIDEKTDMGFSFDGDGDRVIAVDERGCEMDGDHIIAACATHIYEQGKLRNNGVVGTVMTNIGFDEYMNSLGIEVHKASVGDRYVLEKMVAEDFVIGGEQSGHIIFIDDNTTGDGMLTALKLAESVIDSGRKLSELNDLMITYPQVLINAKVTNDYKKIYLNDEVINDEIEKLEAQFAGEGRVLIRPSGTEPVIRVMIEGKDQEKLEKAAIKLADLIEHRCSN